MTGIPAVTIPKGLIRGLEELEIGGRANYGIVEVGQNTEKSPGNLKRFSVTQTTVKGYQLTMV